LPRGSSTSEPNIAAAPSLSSTVAWNAGFLGGAVMASLLLAAQALRRGPALARTARAAAANAPGGGGGDGGEGSTKGIGAAAAAAVREAPKRWLAFEEVGVTEPLLFWDPLGICPKEEKVFSEFRACELKHGRVAMMAAVGAVVQHFIRFPGFDRDNFGEPLPAGLAAIPNTPASFGFTVLLSIAAFLELFLWSEDFPKKEAGNFGDPLGLNQYTRDMRDRELNNGRFAMFAAAGILAGELATGKDAVQQLGF